MANWTFSGLCSCVQPAFFRGEMGDSRKKSDGFLISQNALAGLAFFS